MSGISEVEGREVTKVIMYGEVSVAITALLLGERFKGIDVSGLMSKEDGMLIPEKAEIPHRKRPLFLAALCAGQSLRHRMAMNQNGMRPSTKRGFQKKVIEVIDHTFQYQFNEFKNLTSLEEAYTLGKWKAFFKSSLNLGEIRQSHEVSDRKQVFDRLIKELQTGLTPLAGLIDEVARSLLESEDAHGRKGVASWDLIANLIHAQTHRLNLESKLDSYSILLKRIHSSERAQPKR